MNQLPRKISISMPPGRTPLQARPPTVIHLFLLFKEPKWYKAHIITKRPNVVVVGPTQTESSRKSQEARPGELLPSAILLFPLFSHNRPRVIKRCRIKLIKNKPEKLLLLLCWVNLRDSHKWIKMAQQSVQTARYTRRFNTGQASQLGGRVGQKHLHLLPLPCWVSQSLQVKLWSAVSLTALYELELYHASRK